MVTANFIHPKPRIPDLLWCAQISPKTFLVTSPLSLLTSKPQLDRRISFLGVKRRVPWNENRWHPSQDTWSMIVFPAWLKKRLCDLAFVFISYWKWRKLLSSSLFGNITVEIGGCFLHPVHHLGNGCEPAWSDVRNFTELLIFILLSRIGNPAAILTGK